MLYASTRNRDLRVSSAEAIEKGISTDGGLFVPTEIPTVKLSLLENLLAANYQQRAKKILALFLTDYTDTEIENCVQAAYTDDKFLPEPAHFKDITAKGGILELWRGPTSAFKDMALQILPHLLGVAIRKNNNQGETIILVATSGDTGKAALEGFANVPNTKIIVFYPHNGVSKIQKLQMATQQGDNVYVLAVEGNFDDAQTGVKKIFANKKFNMELAAEKYQLSSANSINWGRLVPQVVYYFSAYLDAINNNKIKLGDKINFVVPTGNFGNILAAYYAKGMGLPVNKLICASNINDVLTEFLSTGVYNKNRAFHKTISPSMDILISSNVERLLYILSGGNSNLVQEYFAELEHKGEYTVNPEIFAALQKTFVPYQFDDLSTKNAIHKLYTEKKYLLDTHTAVAWQAFTEYSKTSGDDHYSIVVSTASPFKFSEDVLDAIGGKSETAETEFAVLRNLSALTNWSIPEKMSSLEKLPVLHTQIIAKDLMEEYVRKLILK